MQNEKLALTNRGEFLADSFKKLETQEGLKFEIKKKLNVALSGESVAIIVEEPKPTSTTVSKTTSWQQLKNFFKNLFD